MAGGRGLRGGIAIARRVTVGRVTVGGARTSVIAGRAGVAALLAATLLLCGAVNALAESKTFSSGCQVWEVPSGVKSVSILAVGGRGGDYEAEEGNNGDEVTATAPVTAHQKLDVCAAYGGGSAGSGFTGPPEEGEYFPALVGGGASGVSLGSDFSNPVVVAGGGGGNGGRGEGNGTSFPFGGAGGAARQPGGASFGTAGGKVEGGAKTNSEGPGRGGNGGTGTNGGGGGGGGGAGYVGGGGGEGSSSKEKGGGGGAGGTDFCGGTGVVCSPPKRSTEEFGGYVTLTYTVVSAAPTTLTTTLNSEREHGASISAKEGEQVEDQATLSGENAAKASGEISYSVYSNSACSGTPLSVYKTSFTSDQIPSSAPFLLTAGTYYFQAHYSGDENNQESTSECGAEVLTVTGKPKPTTLSTSLSGEGKSGESITVKEGEGVSDKASLSGENASKATGTVTYGVYSDSECTKLVKEAGTGSVTAGTVEASESETLAQGTYYFQAHYSGDENNQESTSKCGSEILTVLAKSSISTYLTQDGEPANRGEKITVKEGAEVFDTALIKGHTDKSEGSASFKVYSDAACTQLVGEAGSHPEPVPSDPTSNVEKLPAGTYYWQAEYAGDATNAPSKSECGAEVLTVTASCGKTTIGRSAPDPLLANLKRVNACQIPYSALVSEITIYLSPTSTKGTQLVRGILYSDVKGKPRSLLGATEALTFTSKSPAGWYHLRFAAPIKVAAGSYWIGMLTGATQYVAAERYDSVSGAEDYNSNTYTSGPSKTYGSYSTDNEQMSLYATFVPEQSQCEEIAPRPACF